MRLPGRIAAAAEVLADMEARRRPSTEALRDWGLSHRFAGSGDRAAIGNLVHDALRRRASLAWRMGEDSAWALAVGAAIVALGETPEALNAAFAADPHAPAPIPTEVVERLAEANVADAPPAMRADVPDWTAPLFERAFGADWPAEGAALAGRPPLDLRVNRLKAGRDKAASQLARLRAEPTRLSPVGLRIGAPQGEGRHPNVQAEEAYQRGRVEIQDEGSQICALLVGCRPGEQVLDFCAGAGGKTLALAAEMGNRGQIYAFDRERQRLAPIFERLKRAGVRNVQVRPPEDGALDDLAGRMDRVLVDAPCSGSGVWRRRPDAKWRLTADALEKRLAEQDAALAAAARFVRPGGLLAYATCSVFLTENEERIAAFLQGHPDFAPVAPRELWAAGLPESPFPDDAAEGDRLLLTPRRTETDGFFFTALRRRS